MSSKTIEDVTKILFLGTLGLFSRVILESLLSQGDPSRTQEVVGIFVPSRAVDPWAELPRPTPLSQSDIPMVPSFVGHSIIEIGWHSAIPVWEINPLSLRDLFAITALQQTLALSEEPDVLVVACWPERLPLSLLSWISWGGLNVHPSLLPNFRGPAPLFWQRRAGLRESGVTIHQMTESFDTGPILAQAPLPLPDGATGEEIDILAAHLGGQLLAQLLSELHRGQSKAQPQPTGGSYQSWPSDQDFIIPVAWSARHAWNFMRAAAEWKRPFVIEFLDGECMTVQKALDFLPVANLSAPFVHGPDGIAIQFSPGVLRVIVSSE